MNHNLFRDLARSVANKQGLKDEQAKIDLSREEAAKTFHRAIQAFIYSPNTGKESKEIQAFTGSSDIAILTKDVFNVTNQVPNYDTMWQESFRTVNLRRGELQWEIANVNTAAQFELIPEGQKVKIQEYTGTKVTVGINKYGMGLGFTWEMREGRKMYLFIDQLEQTRAKLFSLWANVHYGLLASAGALNNILYQGAATDSTLSRDIATINKGYEDLGEATKDKGYGDTANARMILYVSPKLKARVLAALRTTDVTIANTQGQKVIYNVEPKFSWNSNIPTDKGLLVLPGNKIQNAVYMQNMQFSDEDIESLNDISTYWTAFGATVADTDQVYELDFA